MALSFNSNGNLICGEHELSLEEFHKFFVEEFECSNTREKIYKNFIEVLNFLVHLGFNDFSIWIDGSYTTSKLDPNDIDFSIIIDRANTLSFNQGQKQIFRQLFYDVQPADFRNLLHDNYDCDVYIVVDAENYPNDKYYKKFMDCKKYWYNWWSHDRDGNEKGFVKLNVKGGLIQ